MTIRFMQRIAGVATDVAAAVVATASSLVATNASGTIDPSFFPAGFGNDIVTATASEALAAGALVNIYNNSGAVAVRNADSATGAAGKKTSGFVQSSVASGAAASIYRTGMNTGLTGLTPGADYYMGASGAATVTPPSTSGTTSQYIGTAVSATVLDVQPQSPIAIN